MRKLQLFFIIIFSGVTLYLEFRDIKEDSFPISGDSIEVVSAITLCILTIVYFFKSDVRYQQRRNMLTNLPSFFGLLILVATGGHMLFRSYIDNSTTAFKATNFDLGNDGGFTLDFKKNMYLKGFKIDHFSATTYWGTYQQQGDTLVLNIPLDFELGRHAVVKDSIMYFIDDKVKFQVYRK